MKIRRIRLVLPPRMRHSAGADARTIADAVAGTLAKGGSVDGPLRVEVAGAGRPANHLRAGLAHAVNRALGARPRRD